MQNQWRLKSMVVLCEFETLLAQQILQDFEIIKKGSPGIIQKILERVDRSEIEPEHILHKAYLSELVSMFCILRRQAGDQSTSKDLENLVQSLDVLSIRNACAHPTRPFFEYYWYRLCAFGLDPLFDRLGFGSLSAAVRRAQEGQIDPLPEDWFETEPQSVPNTLPDALEHSITGLVGRAAERQRFKQLLQSSRNNFAAITGPGGTGKTALLLDVIDEICSDPLNNEWLDACTFISAKQTALTSSGIETLSAPDTFKKIKLQVIEDYLSLGFCESLCSSILDLKDERRILLCLDNMEQFIINNSDDIVEFNDQLPKNWKLVVTSRIQVPQASTIPLSEMSNSESRSLAYMYAKRIALSNFENCVIDQIVKASLGNPLAIRLMLDTIVAGAQIHDAIGITKEAIADFSFKNLLCALPDDAIVMLESIRIGAQTRISIRSLLDWTDDRLAEATGILARTSLIQRTITEDTEFYLLNSAVNEMLLADDRAIEAREQGNEIERKRRENNIQIRKSFEGVISDEFHFKFIPKIDSQAEAVLGRALRIISRARSDPQQLRHIHTELETLRAAKPELAVVWAYLGEVRRLLKDFAGADEAVAKAVELSDRHPRYVVQLARLRGQRSAYDEAFVCWKEIEARGFLSEDTAPRHFILLVYREMLMHATFAGFSDVVLEKTKNFKDAGVLKGIFGVARAAMYKRQAENLRGSERSEKIRRACSILDECANDEEAHANWKKVAQNLFREIRYLSVRELWASDVASEQSFCFVQKYFNVVFDDPDETEAKEYIKAMAGTSCPKNPFRTHKWLCRAARDLPNTSSLDAESGWIRVKIYSAYADKPFVFAENAAGEQFYVHRNVPGARGSKGNELRTGDTFEIQASASSRGPKRAATRVRFI